MENPFEKLKALKEETKALEKQIDEYINFKSVDLQDNILKDIRWFKETFTGTLWIEFSLNKTFHRFECKDNEDLSKYINEKITSIFIDQLRPF